MARTLSKSKRSFDTQIDLPQDARNELVALLNQQMADNADLYSQVKQAHWNVKGQNFMQLHELFDQLAEAIQGFTDELAERATALGGYAEGTVRMAAEASTLAEYPVDAVDGMSHLEAVRQRWAAYAASTRAASERSEQLGDLASQDLFLEIVREVDKGLYFLEAHLQG